jgi:hypothetical protein
MMRIPKIIHYCWFGENEIPEKEKKCIQSWKKILPEYELVLWNEYSFNINSVPYVQQAYENKKYAFVSDYVRMYALFNFGGLYLDTDVEVIKPFDIFLNNKAFIGFENKTMIGTGIIGSSKKEKIFKDLIDYYNGINFVNEKGYLDTTTNVQILAELLSKEGFKKENSNQKIKNIRIYERDIFCPKKNSDGSFNLTDRTVCIHHFSGSWLTDKERKRGTNIIWRKVCRPILKKTRIFLIKIIGDNNAKRIEVRVRNILK